MSEGNEGGLAERGYNGPAQPGGPNTASGGVGSYGSSGSGSNYGSAYGGPPRSQNYVGPGYGITPFAVPRRDQTLQDRMFGVASGSGMVQTSFGGPGGTNNSYGSGYKITPAHKKYTIVKGKRVPVPQPKPTVQYVNGVPIPQPPSFKTNWTNINDFYGNPYPEEPLHPGFEFEYPAEPFNGPIRTNYPGGGSGFGADDTVVGDRGDRSAGAFTGGYGQGGGYGGGISGYANGGLMQMGETGLVGERGPELATTGPGGTQITPLGAMGGRTGLSPMPKPDLGLFPPPPPEMPMMPRPGEPHGFGPGGPNRPDMMTPPGPNRPPLQIGGPLMRRFDRTDMNRRPMFPQGVGQRFGQQLKASGLDPRAFRALLAAGGM